MIDQLSRRLQDCDEVRFFLHWLRQPSEIGAMLPSGPALSAALAAEIDIQAPGVVVELGPGTGRVTKALLESGIEASRLIAVEQNVAFCDLLRARYPGIRVVRGEAQSLEKLLHQNGIGTVKAVVSSLPLLSMPTQERAAVLSQIAAVIHGECIFVQYTYGVTPPVPANLDADLGLVGERTNWVLANLPPAAVWRYRRVAEAPRLLQAS